MFNQVLGAKKYLQISLFNVNNKQYYCILIMKDSKLEPHFEVFYENKFNELVEAFKNKDTKKISDLVNSELFIQKDGYPKFWCKFSKSIIICVFGFSRLPGNKADRICKNYGDTEKVQSLSKGSKKISSKKMRYHIIL
ncbi:hypothetical protein [Campylobacter phage CP21]|uniref:Uncharacterized protein n=1 Tax=Campylobacter phage CP21 TaxID=2881391 RepID=I7KLK3_9CAUD|nr:hypothetical protein F421_gp021 [Campylobacter phage CP21]CCH63483.1 hypothetical protein [Campylobacter phage CP21]